MSSSSSSSYNPDQSKHLGKRPPKKRTKRQQPVKKQPAKDSEQLIEASKTGESEFGSEDNAVNNNVHEDEEVKLSYVESDHSGLNRQQQGELPARLTDEECKTRLSDPGFTWHEEFNIPVH